MAADVYSATLSYLNRINDTIILAALVPPAPQRGGQKQPRPPVKPGRIGSFQKMLMKTYRNIVVVFEPMGRPCTTPSQCRQDEECIDGVCTPVGEGTRAFGGPCTVTSQCRQDEECIDGMCVPVPFVLDFDPRDGVKGSFGDELEAALNEYSHKIQAVISRGLARDKSRVVTVRNVLMQAYVDACKVARWNPRPCDNNGDCPEGYECIDGICVPYPFELRLRR